MGLHRQTKHPAPTVIGCTRIVPMLELRTLTGRHNTTVSYTYEKPFTPQFTFNKGDEFDPPATDETEPPSWAMWTAAYDYLLWSLAGKGSMPEFGQVVDTLCQQRVSMQMGLGGSIYCESKQDAMALKNYYPAAVYELPPGCLG